MDIPRLAYIEAQIVNRAARAGALLPFARDVERQYGAAPGTLGIGTFLETRVLGLLYALVLVPREMWELKANHSIYSRLEKQFPLNDVIVASNLNQQQALFRTLFIICGTLWLTPASPSETAPLSFGIGTLDRISKPTERRFRQGTSSHSWRSSGATSQITARGRRKSVHK